MFVSVSSAYRMRQSSTSKSTYYNVLQVLQGSTARLARGNTVALGMCAIIHTHSGGTDGVRDKIQPFFQTVIGDNTTPTTLSS